MSFATFSALYFCVTMCIAYFNFKAYQRDDSQNNPHLYFQQEFMIRSSVMYFYKRVSILKIETTDEFAKYKFLINKMDGLLKSFM